MLDQYQMIDLMREGIWIAVKIGGPILLASMVVGLIVAVFQAATQIHEQSISFIPKLILIIVFLLAGGNWTLNLMKEFTRMIFLKIAG